jgi:hypothetical protein
MTSSTKPATVNHNHHCEAATQDGCLCRCDGMMHQCDVLVAAFESPKTLADFDIELTGLFGSAFTTTSTDPAAGEKSRRKWTPIANAGTAKRASQIEQRVVDVAVRDVLRSVYALSPARKRGWLEFLEAITLQSSWPTVVLRIESIAGPHDARSGYYWSSILAASKAVVASGSSLSAAAVASFLSSTSTDFEHVRHPRARSGKRVQLIKEMALPQAVAIGVTEVEKAWRVSPLPDTDKRAILAIVGSVLCADLWRSPAAVRDLLLPAIGHLRVLAPGIQFSLDSPSRNLEQVIDDELGQKWAAGGAW